MYRDIAVARSADGGKTFQSSIVSSDRWELNGCPIAGASMTIDDRGRLHVVWFTQKGELPRLYIATSGDRGRSFTSPVVFDPGQKLAKHAHAVGVNDRILISWDDVNGTSMVKWGLYNPTNQSMKILGIQAGASYPIIAAGGSQIGLVALQSDHPQVFRTIRRIDL
jgi:hypothetical protein